jgi:colanic acid biosynthesis glycosyl transferase WcaI
LKILLLNQAFYPDVVSTAQHLADLAAGLAARGHEVTVIASRRAYDEPQQRFLKQQTWQGVRIVRVGGTGFGKNAKWRRALDFASFLGCCWSRAVRLPPQQIIVALTSPPLISMIGLTLARLWRARFIYWVMDLNPDQALAAAWISPHSATARVLEWLSRLTLRQADRVIALDEFMVERIARKGIARERLSVLPPWPHDNEVRFDPRGRSRFRREHGLEGKFVVMYSGNHSPYHPLDTVLAAARRLAACDDIVFCFIGGGSEFRRIRGLAESAAQGAQATKPDFAWHNVLCLPYQPRSGLSASLSSADLHLTVLGDGFVGLVHPCKVYNVLRVGTPVVYIGPIPSPISELLAKVDGQVPSGCVNHGDVDGLVREIWRIRKLPAAARAPLPAATHSSQTELVLSFIALVENSGGNSNGLGRQHCWPAEFRL